MIQVTLAWTGGDYDGAAFAGIALEVEATELGEAREKVRAFVEEATELGEAREKVRAFVEEVAELAEAHPGIEIVSGSRSLLAHGAIRAVLLADHRRNAAAKAARQ